MNFAFFITESRQRDFWDDMEIKDKGLFTLTILTVLFRLIFPFLLYKSGFIPYNLFPLYKMEKQQFNKGYINTPACAIRS